MQNSHHKIALTVVILFTLAQIVILIATGHTPYPDSKGYLSLAEEAVTHGDIYPIASKMHELAFLWNIGAINTAAFSLRIFDSILPLLLIYSFLKGLTAGLFYLFVAKLLSTKTALIALILYVVYPANYGESTSLLSELPFIFFAIAALFLISRNHFLLAGISLAIANWYRPMASVFILAIIFFLISDYFLNHRRHITRQLATILIGFVLTITAIGASEHHRTGRFFYQAATGWMALMQYSWDNDGDTVSDTHLFKAGNPNVIAGKYDVIDKDSIWRNNFFLWLRHNKAEYIKQMPKKFIDTYATDNTTFCTFLPNKNTRQYMYDEVSMGTIIKDFPRLTAVQSLACANLIYYYIVILLALAAIASVFKRSIKCCSPDGNELTAVILSVSVITVGTLVLLFFGHGESRFHQPFMPFFLMLAAMTLSRFQRRKSSRPVGTN